MSKEIYADAQIRMKKSIENLKSDLTKVRTGRANPSLLEHLVVDYYGAETPIGQVASIVVEDARTLSITPWEKTMVQAIEKAIMNSDLGLNPTTAGSVMRVSMPPLTEERRKDLGKLVSQEGEKTKVAVRNIRRDANNHYKEQLKEKLITEDEVRQKETEMQTLTDNCIKQIDEVVAKKMQELMEI